jgi:hypothetical protein
MDLTGATEACARSVFMFIDNEDGGEVEVDNGSVLRVDRRQPSALAPVESAARRRGVEADAKPILSRLPQPWAVGTTP